MFDEHNALFTRPGTLEVICGCMFSGKTEELITQIRRAEIARLRFQVFKPVVDTRYDDDAVASHDKSKSPAINVSKAYEIWQMVVMLWVLTKPSFLTILLLRWLKNWQMTGVE